MAERAVSELAFYSARPTVRIDSQEYPKVGELMVSMEMTEREGGLSSLELRCTNVASDGNGNAALAFEDDSILRLGARIAVYAGEETAPSEIFQGIITGLEADFPTDGTPTLVALAEDAFQRARMKRRTRVHESVSLADLAGSLASDLGLTPVVTGLDQDIGIQVQLNESDLAFLRRLLARYDADLQVVGEELHVSPRTDVQRGEIEVELHGQLRRARVLVDLAHQVTTITVGGWNVQQGEKVESQSEGGHFGPGQGRTGSAVLRDAIGDRPHRIGHIPVTTVSEADAVAAAACDERARRFVSIEGTVEGNARLRVGSTVRVSGMGARFGNTYYVVLARHRFDLERGYETDFTGECAFFGGTG